MSIMSNRGLILYGNTGGTPTENTTGEPGVVLRLALVAAVLLPATLGRGR